MLIKQGVDRIDLGDGEWVDIKDRLTIGDYDRIQRLGENYGPALATLIAAVVAWNLTDDGQPADVTPENIARMEPFKAIQMCKEIGDRNKAPKKGSTRKSTPV